MLVYIITFVVDEAQRHWPLAFGAGFRFTGSPLILILDWLRLGWHGLLGLRQ